MTRDFRWTLSTIAHLPAAACTVSAPGSESPPGRGGGAEHRDGRVLFVFAVVSKRLCVARIVGSSPILVAAFFCRKSGWLPGKDQKKGVQLADPRPQNLVS
jgi:hypothetical protein